MDQGNPMLGVAVAAMRWHHARLHRIEMERRHKGSIQASPFGLAGIQATNDLIEARRIESRYKRRLSQSCEKASDKPTKHEIIDI